MQSLEEPSIVLTPSFTVLKPTYVQEKISVFFLTPWSEPVQSYYCSTRLYLLMILEVCSMVV